MQNNTPSDQLPQEWQSRIQQDALNYSIVHANQQLYIIAVTPYALRAYKAEQEVDRLRTLFEKTKWLIETRADKNSTIQDIWDCADEALHSITPQPTSRG